MKGKLANYTVSLRTGGIYFENTRYICVVPETAYKRKKIFLPFEEEDRKTSEILSKILLLVNDNKIKDETIMTQINRYLEGDTQLLAEVE